jgi:hypothetical protein
VRFCFQRSEVKRKFKNENSSRVVYLQKGFQEDQLVFIVAPQYNRKLMLPPLSEIASQS